MTELLDLHLQLTVLSQLKKVNSVKFQEPISQIKYKQTYHIKSKQDWEELLHVM